MKRADFPACDSCERPTQKLLVVAGAYWRRPGGRVPLMACPPCARRLGSDVEAFDGLTGLELEAGLTTDDVGAAAAEIAS